MLAFLCLLYALTGLGIAIGSKGKITARGKLAYALVFPVHGFFLFLHEDRRDTWVPHGLSMILTGLIVGLLLSAAASDPAFLLLGIGFSVLGLLRMTSHGNDRGPLI